MISKFLSLLPLRLLTTVMMLSPFCCPEFGFCKNGMVLSPTKSDIFLLRTSKRLTLLSSLTSINVADTEIKLVQHYDSWSYAQLQSRRGASH